MLIPQFLVISFAIALAACTTEGARVYCDFSNDPHFAKLWLDILRYLSLESALVTILSFYLNLKSKLAVQRPLLKLVAFKTIVVLTFLESVRIIPEGPLLRLVQYGH